MAVRKVSARQSSKQEKSDQQPNPEAVAAAWRHHEALKLAEQLELVLKSPACPDALHGAIVDCLSDIQTRNDCYNEYFLVGLLLSTPRQVEGGAK
jgi:hypothetical protein